MRGRTRTRTPAGGRNSRARAGAGSGDANRSRRTTTAGRRAGAVPAGSRPTPGATRPARRARHFRKRQPKSNGSAATRGRRQRGARTRGLPAPRSPSGHFEPRRPVAARFAPRPADPSGLRSRFLRHRRPAPSGRGPPETRCAPCRSIRLGIPSGDASTDGSGHPGVSRSGGPPRFRAGAIRYGAVGESRTPRLPSARKSNRNAIRAARRRSRGTRRPHAGPTCPVLLEPTRDPRNPGFPSPALPPSPSGCRPVSVLAPTGPGRRTAAGIFRRTRLFFRSLVPLGTWPSVAFRRNDDRHSSVSAVSTTARPGGAGSCGRPAALTPVGAQRTDSPRQVCS